MWLHINCAENCIIPVENNARLIIICLGDSFSLQLSTPGFKVNIWLSCFFYILCRIHTLIASAFLFQIWIIFRAVGTCNVLLKILHLWLIIAELGRAWNLNLINLFLLRFNIINVFLSNYFSYSPRDSRWLFHFLNGANISIELFVWLISFLLHRVMSDSWNARLRLL